MSTVLFGFLLALLALLAINVVIFVHELGHWLVAKACGMQTPVFSLGFGSRRYSLVLGTWWQTEFRLSPIPLGGYVTVIGLGEDSNQEATTRRFAIWKRACVLVAGVVFNALFAMIILAGIFLAHGRGDGYNVVVTEPFRTTSLQAGDVIKTIYDSKITGQDDILKLVPEAPYKLHIVRAGTEMDIIAITDKLGQIGIAHGRVIPVYTRLGFVAATEAAGIDTYDELLSNAIGLAKMVHIIRPPHHADVKVDTGKDSPPQKNAAERKPSNKTEKQSAKEAQNSAPSNSASAKPAPSAPAPSLSDLHGFVGIVYFGAQLMSSLGIPGVLLFMFKISAAFAFMNLLPLPLLDGGHLLFLGIEKVRGRPVSNEAKGRIAIGGIVFILALAAWSLRNDIVTLWSDGHKLIAASIMIAVTAGIGCVIWDMLSEETKAKLVGFKNRLRRRSQPTPGN
jgi:regulator of sigma E protease